MLIRYYGPVGIPGGYGRAAAETCMAILAAGLDLEICAYHPQAGAGHQNHLHERYRALVECVRSDERPPAPNPDVCIVHTLPMDCARVLERVRLDAQWHTVAYTTWEGASPMPPHIVDALAVFDHVWVPSRVSLVSVNRSHIVPHAFDDTVERTAVHHEHHAHVDLKPRRFRFYTIGTWSERKNLAGLLRAYLRAFTRHDDVELLIHSAGTPNLAYLSALVAAVDPCHDEHARIEFKNGYEDDSYIQELHRNSDCFVTASRGEAWHFPAFDAMMAGRHIITAGRLGSDDFLIDTSAWRYESRVTPAFAEAETVSVSGRTGLRRVGTDLTCKDDWREPDLGALAVLMRRAYAESVTDLTTTYDPYTRYGRAAVGQRIRQLLEEGLQR